jgi:hypothetical protein
LQISQPCRQSIVGRAAVHDKCPRGGANVARNAGRSAIHGGDGALQVEELWGGWRSVCLAMA